MRALIRILGFGAGVALATALIALRPAQLLQLSPEFAAPDAIQMRIKAGFRRGVRDGGFSILGRQDHLGGRLDDPALRFARFSVALFDGGGDGGPALGIKLSGLDRDNQLVTGQMRAGSVWNLIWPGQGGMFLTGREDRWQLVVDSLRNAIGGKGFRPMEQNYPLTPSRSADFANRLVGASGYFADVTGEYREWYMPTSNAAVRGALDITIRSQ